MSINITNQYLYPPEVAAKRRILAGTTTGIEPMFAAAYKRRYLKGIDCVDLLATLTGQYEAEVKDVAFYTYKG